MPTPETALPGRAEEMPVPLAHYVNGHPLRGPFPAHLQQIVFGMGCFWGVERIFWQLEGVFSTAVGYAAGLTPNPTYQEVCSGRTGHNEVVLVVFDPAQVSVEQLLKAFWEGHNPTQGMRQSNDMGTQYRSGIYPSDDAQKAWAIASQSAVQQALAEALRGRTSLVIAHRLSTVRQADVILVIEEGRVVERGTHDELLAKSGLYATLYATQFED